MKDGYTISIKDENKSFIFNIHQILNSINGYKLIYANPTLGYVVVEDNKVVDGKVVEDFDI